MLKIFFLILVAILSIKYILFWTYVWQLKEYRWDRFRDFLRSREGRAAFLNKFYLAKIVFLIFAAVFFVIRTQINILYEILAFLGYIILFFESVVFISRVLKNNFIKPVFTKKAVLLILISVLISAVFFSGGGLLSAILTLVLMPFFAGFANLIMYPFSQFIKDKKVEAARHIMEKFNGAVIGITGSYGKSSVKEFTAALLEKRFNVLKTPKNINTEIGVANLISQKSVKLKVHKVSGKVFGGYDYFICEMGAYRVGEIEKLCKMVKPKIGILTGINEQHMALFGSIENTIKAKFELIKSLSDGGIAIINWDDENCRKVKVPAGIRRITYGFSKDSDFRIVEEVKEVKDGEKGIGEIRNWKLEIGGEKVVLCCKLIGRHSSQNLLPAIIAAREAGMEWNDIQTIIAELAPSERGIKLKKMGSAIIIDDTYNSNPAGVRAALEVLDDSGKEFKILVLDDIWELGKEGERIHRELAEEISRKKYYKIILVGKEYGKLMKDVLAKNGVDEEIILKNPLSAQAGFLFPPEKGGILMEYSKKGVAILFEGRRAGKYINNFKF